MKKIEISVSNEQLIEAYKDLKSTYKVAKKFGTSRTAVTRILKDLGVLRTQSQAHKEKDISHLKYERTDEHRKRLSEVAKTRVNDKNSFYGKKHKDETKKVLSEKAKERVGKKNPNYKNGDYQRRPRDYKYYEFKPLKNFVLNRDDYTCKYCSLMGGHLHVHHILPFWVCKDAFLDVDNLITVCTKCHFEKAHLGNWSKFDTELISEKLYKKYKLDRERLNELAANKIIS